MKSLIQPQINLNGTSKNQLLEQQVEVLEHFRRLLGAMVGATPHGRDYQLRPEEYQFARDAWLERYTALDAMYREIEAHALLLSDS